MCDHPSVLPTSLSFPCIVHDIVQIRTLPFCSWIVRHHLHRYVHKMITLHVQTTIEMIGGLSLVPGITSWLLPGWPSDAGPVGNIDGSRLRGHKTSVRFGSSKRIYLKCSNMCRHRPRLVSSLFWLQFGDRGMCDEDMYAMWMLCDCGCCRKGDYLLSSKASVVPPTQRTKRKNQVWSSSVSMLTWRFWPLMCGVLLHWSTHEVFLCSQDCVYQFRRRHVQEGIDIRPCRRSCEHTYVHLYGWQWSLVLTQEIRWMRRWCSSLRKTVLVRHALLRNSLPMRQLYAANFSCTVNTLCRRVAVWSIYGYIAFIYELCAIP